MMQKRILLVDDESALRRSLSLGLNQFGYDVEPCENGLTALNTLEAYKQNDISPDVVILDIQLPDINGKKLGRIIKNRYPDTPMFYITGYAEELDLAEIEELQADGLLEKPFDANELSGKIQSVLESHPPKKETVVQERDTAKTVSAYVLISAENDEEFFPLYQKLYFTDNVLYCDAVRGDKDIFLLIQADSADFCEKYFNEAILSMKGIKSAEYLPVGVPVLNENIRQIINSAGITMFEDMPGMNKIRDNKKSVCSYVVVDVEREYLANLYPVLKLTDNVLYCDYISGHASVILMLYGTQFSEIDRIIEKKISRLEGVIKVKKYPVINIFEM
ncbi:MAG: response regulator [Ignavibacteriaceae bacterium]|nr:response regulator [Ignavibacteriaceae bacterium]